MQTAHLISTSYIKENDFSKKIEATSKKQGLNFSREVLEYGVFYNISKPNYGGTIEVISPKLSRFEESMDLNINNYGTLAGIDYDFANNDDGIMLPLIFELLKELEDVLLIDDEGEWIYFPSDTPIDEEGYDRIRTSEYKKGDVVY